MLCSLMMYNVQQLPYTHRVFLPSDTYTTAQQQPGLLLVLKAWLVMVNT